MAMERVIEQYIPLMPQYKAILYTHNKYIRDLKKRQLKDKFFEPELEKEATCYWHNPAVHIYNALYFGTKNSASNRIPNADYKIKLGIAAQLYLGVRFLDFEITTFERTLWVVCGGGYAMHGDELFTILKAFVDNQRVQGNLLKEKIILNFREHGCVKGHLMPTWELLSACLIRYFDLGHIPGYVYLVSRADCHKLLRDMIGVFIILAPEDLNLALDQYYHYNWRSNSVVKVEPKFNGSNDCILQWANMQEVRGYDEFPKFRGELVWLDISDPFYTGTANHEIQSMRDGKLLYPDEKPRFNIISFGSLCSNDVTKFLKYIPKYNTLD